MEQTSHSQTPPARTSMCIATNRPKANALYTIVSREISSNASMIKALQLISSTERIDSNKPIFSITVPIVAPIQHTNGFPQAKEVPHAPHVLISPWLSI